MMKAMKKMVTMLLVIAMVLSLNVTAFAAKLETGTLKVHGAELAGKDVTAVLMFNANVDSEDAYIGKGDTVAYELDAAWQDFFNKKLNKGSGVNATSDEAYQYAVALTGTDLVNFAKEAKAEAKAKGMIGTVIKADSTDTATFANLAAGYYLVFPESGSTSADRQTDAMLVNVPGEKAANLELKSKYPTVDKTVDANVDNTFGEQESAQIGDTVNFQLRSEVPDMSEYTTYKFRFVDNMSAGLSYVDKSVKVTIGATVIPEGNYTVAYDSAKNMLTVEFADLKAVGGINAGDPVKVEYSAVLNEKAEVEVANTNKAHVEYSNDPNTDGMGSSKEDKADVYTFDIVVNKHNDAGQVLPGAVFKLKDADKNVVKLVKESDTEYRVAKDGEVSAVETFVTVETTNITVKGLETGVYYLEEVTAPTGYNKLTEDVKIEIAAQYGEGAPTLTYTVTYAGQAQTGNTSLIKVLNKTGAVLPETGSIGTIGLTLAGVALVIAGITMTSRKKKEQK